MPGLPVLGLIEFTLLLVPFAVYVIWRYTAAQGGPSLLSLSIGTVAVAILTVALFWYIRTERIDPGAVYVPPRIQDGRLIPGHAVPP